MKKRIYPVALTALAAVALILPSCVDDPGTSTSSSTDTTSSTPQVDVDTITVNRDAKTRIAVGEVLDISENITIKAVDGSSSVDDFQLVARSENITVIGKTVKALAPGDFEVQIIAGRNGIKRNYSGLVVSEGLAKVDAFVADLNVNYSSLVQVFDGTQAGYVSITSHNEQYFIDESDGSGVIEFDNGHAYNFVGVNTGTEDQPVISDYQIKPGRIPVLKELVIGQSIGQGEGTLGDLTIYADQVNDQGESVGVTIDRSVVNDVLYTATGGVQLALIEYYYNAGAVGAYNVEVVTEEDGQGGTIEYLSILGENANYPFFELDILLKNETVDDILEAKLTAAVEPTKLQNANLENFINDINANKKAYTVTSEMSWGYQAYDENDNVVWYTETDEAKIDVLNQNQFQFVSGGATSYVGQTDHVTVDDTGAAVAYVKNGDTIYGVEGQKNADTGVIEWGAPAASGLTDIWASGIGYNVGEGMVAPAPLTTIEFGGLEELQKIDYNYVLTANIENDAGETVEATLADLTPYGDEGNFLYYAFALRPGTGWWDAFMSSNLMIPGSSLKWYELISSVQVVVWKDTAGNFDKMDIDIVFSGLAEAGDQVYGGRWLTTIDDVGTDKTPDLVSGITFDAPAA